MKRALISVSDKKGLSELSKALVELGFELLSTGGTAAAIRQAGLPVTEVSDITDFPECLDGRVKTLHPAVHAGILARRDIPEHMEQLKTLKIAPIDVVVINLYPFKQTIAKPGVSLEDAIENIDIGGPSMLRGAAKNWQDVCVITDPADYDALISALKAGGAAREQKFLWAQKVFEHTANYDAMIARYLANRADITYPDTLTLTFEKVQPMRYGENPHQSAAFYREPVGAFGTIADAVQLHGKELSFNNINDTAAALALLREFPAETPCAVAVKHANPCGVGCGETVKDAYLRAYDCDPVSIFGGIVALNAEVDEPCANELAKTFLEVIIAPAFSAAALAVLEKKKNVRLLTLPCEHSAPTYDLKKVAGGLLIQSCDDQSDEELTIITKRAPSEDEIAAMRFAWKVCKHTRSNAIVLGRKDAICGIGPGQTNRITALELAIKYAGEKARGSVMASDAYFPFDDCVRAAHAAGVTAIIQPGGSVRDEESIKACDELGIAMVFTGARHFRH